MEKFASKEAEGNAYQENKYSGTGVAVYDNEHSVEDICERIFDGSCERDETAGKYCDTIGGH